MRAVIDASVAAKWFNKEEYSKEAVALKEAYVEGFIELMAPIHLIYEVGNSIWKNRQLDVKDASKAVSLLLNLDLNLLEPTAGDLERAMEIAREVDITFYDALYVQLAEKYRVKLITADNEQVKKSKGIIDVIHIKDFSAGKRV